MSTKVFVLGATGYIGGGVARAFRRAGYFVYGTTRSNNTKAHSNLIKDEIVPLVGDASSPEHWKEQLTQSSIIIDTVGFVHDSPHTSHKFFEYVVNLKKQTIQNYKALYIFTSGIMTYATGARVDFLLDESFNPNPSDPVDMVPRKALEDTILHNLSVRPVVVRPGFVYGGTGGVIAKIFFSVKPDAPEIIGYGSLEKKWSWVHVDDLGEAYVKIAKAGSVVDNQVFNIAALGDNPTFLELKYFGAKAAGWRGNKLQIKSVPIPEQEKRMQNWEWNVVINPAKATDLLGWIPAHVGVINEIELYYQSWKVASSE